jgi:hypothetical protein
MKTSELTGANIGKLYYISFANEYAVYLQCFTQYKLNLNNIADPNQEIEHIFHRFVSPTCEYIIDEITEADVNIELV